MRKLFDGLMQKLTFLKKPATPQVPGVPGAGEPKPALRDRLKGFKFTRKNILIIAGALILAAILIKTTANIHQTIFKKKDAQEGALVSFEDDAVPVKVYKVKRMDFKDTLPALGNIKGFKEIDLKFQVPGILESYNFEEGEKIQEGDIIASLSQKEALLKLKYAEIELSKAQKLFEIGGMTQLKLDQTKLEYESAKTELDKTNIYASNDGLLGTKLIDVGSYVTPNDKIGTFVKIEKVYAEFNIIEKDVPKIMLGQRAEVFVDSYPNKAYSGVVDRIAPVIEGRSRTQNVKVEVGNRDGDLRPGMFARALIATYEKKDALVVPSSSLKKKDADYFVYVVVREMPQEAAAPAEEETKDGGFFGFFKPKPKEEEAPLFDEKPPEYGTVEIRTVKLGYMTQDLVEIDDGLKEGEMIIVEVTEEFKDGARVEIAEVQEGLF